MPDKYITLLHVKVIYSLLFKPLQISYADGRYICFARDQDKWLSSDAKTVEVDNLLSWPLQQQSETLFRWD